MNQRRRRARETLQALRWEDTTRRLANWINPVAASSAAPLETTAYLDSFSTSVMPRTSLLQGAVAGLSVLAARSVSYFVERGTDAVVPEHAPLPVRLAARTAFAGAGHALSMIPEAPEETMWRSSLRTTGRLVRAGAVGGAVYDGTVALRDRFPTTGVGRPLVSSAVLTAGVAYWAGNKLQRRRQTIERWPVQQKYTLGGSIAASLVVSQAGTGLFKGFVASRNVWIRYFGDSPTRQLVARVVNAGVWTLAGMAAYNAGVGYIGRANEKVEPGYSHPPDSELVSGSPGSFSPFHDLGQQGRRYVTDVMTPEIIEEVMGEPAVAEPIRVFIGFNSEPVYQAGRAELALSELERTGALDRSYLLLVSPTGTGWVDQTMIEAAELLARGDIATACIQYGRYPSFLSLQKIALGRGQFRLLLWGINQRIRERPPEKRPKVLVFGESLGAWTSSDVVMFQGIKGFDHYGIDRALWVGLPGMAKWSRTGMARGSSELVPEGSVGVFDNHDELAALSAEERDRLRAVILSHDNDPIALLSPDVLVREPRWLKGERGRGVPDSMEWTPLVSFFQIMIDAGNAMVTVPGHFGSFGHDYRADMTRFVADAYHLPPATEEQLVAVEEALVQLELDRAERIKAENIETAPPAPAQREDGERRVVAGVPLAGRRTGGANWLQSILGKQGPPPGDVQ